jgi:hypothetical protein
MVRLAVPVVFFLSMLATSCGGGLTDPPRQLVSITVTPTTADAQDFANGQVQFSATGKFSDGTTAPISVMWSANPPFTLVANFYLLNGSGLGQCSGNAGNMIVYATAPSNPSIPLSKMSVQTKNVTGMAQLTCP